MQGKYITTKTRSINYLVENKDTLDKSEQSPLPLHIFPNYMGINLGSVESVTWAEQDDNQLVSLSVQFIPASKEMEVQAKKKRVEEARKQQEVSQNDIDHPKWNNVRGFLEKKREERERKRQRLEQGLPRDELMKTKNMSLGEASRYIKEQGLYHSKEDTIEELQRQLEIARSQRGHSDDAV